MTARTILDQLRNHPKIVVLIGVLFISSSPILIRFSSAPAIAIAFYRTFFAVLILLPLLLNSLLAARRRTAAADRAGLSHTADARSRGTEDSKPASMRTIMLAAIAGLLLALHFTFWISGLQRTTVASATVLVNTHPLFIILISTTLLRERLDIKLICWVVIAFGGSIILSLSGFGADGGSVLGNLLTLLGAVAAAGYLIIGRLLRPHLSTLAYSFCVYLACALALLLFAVVGRIPLAPATYSPQEYLIFVALALLPTLLGHSLFHWALRYLPATFVSTSTLGEPICASLLAAIIFTEIPDTLALIGGAITLTALFFALRSRTPQPA